MSSYTQEDVVQKAKALMREHGDYKSAAAFCRSQQAWADEPGWSDGSGLGADYWRDVAGVLMRVEARQAQLDAAAVPADVRR